MDNNQKRRSKSINRSIDEEMPREKVMDTLNQLHMPNKALMSWQNIASC